MKDPFDILIDHIEQEIGRSLHEGEAEFVKQVIKLYCEEFDKQLLYGKTNLRLSEEIRETLTEYKIKR